MKRTWILTPDKWTKFSPELCKTCWAGCCHKMAVEASIPDMIRLKVLTESEASTSLAKAAKRLLKDGIIQKYDSAKMIFTLKQKPNGDCVFLNEERQCTVYLRRPEICRQFPKIGPRPGHCPYKEKE